MFISSGGVRRGMSLCCIVSRTCDSQNRFYKIEMLVKDVTTVVTAINNVSHEIYM